MEKFRGNREENELKIPNVREFTQTQAKGYFSSDESVWKTGHILLTQKRTIKNSESSEIYTDPDKAIFASWSGLCNKRAKFYWAKGAGLYLEI